MAFRQEVKTVQPLEQFRKVVNLVVDIGERRRRGASLTKIADQSLHRRAALRGEAQNMDTGNALEDRSLLLQLDFNLAGQPTYYTDDVSSEPNFIDEQKVLAGALPQAVARNAAGTRIWVAMGSSGLIQELRVNTAIRPFSVTANWDSRTLYLRPCGWPRMHTPGCDTAPTIRSV